MDLVEYYLFNPRLAGKGFVGSGSRWSDRSDASLVFLSDTSRWFENPVILEDYGVYLSTGKLKITKRKCAEWQKAFLGFCEYKIKKTYLTNDDYNESERVKIKGFRKKRKKIESVLKPLAPMVRFGRAVSSAISRTLKTGKEGKHWECLVGFTKHQLKVHLEELFKKGMTWDNYGLWELDHIIPLVAFNFTKAVHPDFKKCWALTNLQPLWMHDNRSKSAKLEKPYQPTLALEPMENE